MNKLTKCILPVAGFGTRFLPVTKSVPKELLPIRAKPLIQFSVEESMEAGIRDFVLVLNKHKYALKDFFKEHEDLDRLINGTNKVKMVEDLNAIIEKCSFSYIEQNNMLGLGDAIYQAKDFINNESFAVILPDDFCHNNGPLIIKQMADLSEKFPGKCIVAVEEVDSKRVSNYGVIGGIKLQGKKDLFLVNEMIEKPEAHKAPSNLAIIGRYILTHDIFKTLEKVKPDKNGEIQITDALKELAKKGNVLAYKFKGTRIDCGSVDGFIEANNYV